MPNSVEIPCYLDIRENCDPQCKLFDANRNRFVRGALAEGKSVPAYTSEIRNTFDSFSQTEQANITTRRMQSIAFRGGDPKECSIYNQFVQNQSIEK